MTNGIGADWYAIARAIRNRSTLALAVVIADAIHDRHPRFHHCQFLEEAGFYSDSTATCESRGRCGMMRAKPTVAGWEPKP